MHGQGQHNILPLRLHVASLPAPLTFKPERIDAREHAAEKV